MIKASTNILRTTLGAAIFFWLLQGSPGLAQWSLTHRSTTLLSAGSVSGITEMSGVTYLGPSGAVHRFAAAKDNGSGLVRFDVGFWANGSITSAAAVNNLSLDDDDLETNDFEGLAYTNPTRNSVFVSEERTPDISEYSLVTGDVLQTIAVPNLFDVVRDNLGLESLTRSPLGNMMWTTSEESLMNDGPVSSLTQGTTLRLQRFDVVGNAVTAGAQYAYKTEPIHTGTSGQNGVSDLVILPDGSLITLERSRSNSPTQILNRIFRVDFAGATDISDSQFDEGLVGETYTTVAKTLLWSGFASVIPPGLNFEGLALGPYLGNHKWALLGVVDNGGGTSNNFVLSFELTAATCSPTGDYNCDGIVDAEDFGTWKDSYGETVLPFADGNGDGRVSAADFTIWRDNLGASDGSGAAVLLVPEAGTAWLLIGAAFLLSLRRFASGEIVTRNALPVL